MLPIDLRPTRPSDHAFIMHSWKWTLRDSSSWRWTYMPHLSGHMDEIEHTRSIVKRAYFSEVNARCAHLMSKSDTIVACGTEDDDYIVGWLCSEPSKRTLHYGYVKESYRRMGVFTRMLEHAFVTPVRIRLTHWTDACEKMPNYEFRYFPSLLYDQKERKCVRYR